MRVFVVNPPVPVVSWEEADRHLKLDGDTSQQDEVEAMIAAATAHIDGPDGWLGRAIGVQTLEARFERARFGRQVTLPFRPVIDLVSVEYLDQDGVTQTPDIADFEVFGSELAPVGSVFPWEQGSWRREAIRVRYRAGYPELPPALRAAILLMVGDLYAQRSTTVTGDRAAAVSVPMSTTVEALLSPFRVFA